MNKKDMANNSFFFRTRPHDINIMLTKVFIFSDILNIKKRGDLFFYCSPLSQQQ